MTVIEERLIDIRLEHGAHQPNDGAHMCLLEAVAWVAGEPWSDHPECVDPVLASFGRSWNDGLTDVDRTRLLAPFIPRLVGTRSTPDVQDRRAFMAADWGVRVYTPAWLRLAKLDDHATALAQLPELADVTACLAAKPTLDAAWDAAGDAAWDAAGDAAWVAAGDAAGDAARDAARVAAGDAAWDAARDAAGDAAGDAAWVAARVAAGDAARDAARVAAWVAAGDAAGVAAWDAARDAARVALAPTVAELQASAVDLYNRMIGCE